MIIAIASGKGGTGKTTVAVNLAFLAENTQLIDCDVEEPNAHLFLEPVIKHKKKAFVDIPEVNYDKCKYCGKCREVCAYGAIAVLPPSKPGLKGQVMIFDHLCHSCGACVLLCPYQAITFKKREIGVVEIGKSGNVDFVHGKLNIGEAMASPLIRQVKEYIDKTKTVVIDAPPGTSCSVISAVKGSDCVLLVTEPTPFGLNDLKLAIEAIKKMQIPVGVIINRSDGNDEIIEKYCNEEKVSIVLKLPFSRKVAEAYSAGSLLVNELPEYERLFKNFVKNFFPLIKGIDILNRT